MSKISELSDGGVIQGGDTLIAVRSGGNVKVTYGGSTTANIDGGTIDGTVIGGSSAAAGTFTSITGTSANINGTVTADGLTVDGATLLDNGANATHLTLTGTTGRGLEISTATNSYTDNTAVLNAKHSQGILSFETVSTERLRINTNGDVSFYEDTGTTAKLFWDASAESLGIGTTSPASPIDINRSSTDGAIATFRKDGTTVGSIGTRGGDVYLETGDTGIRMYDQSDAIIPVGSAGISRDAAIDLGIAFIRFKDLYLSGGVYLGGTGAANLLDDYEEGTFTPVFADDATAGNTATGGIYGHYTKKGREVTLLLGIGNIDTTGMTAGNSLYVRGLPFASASLAGFVVTTGSMRANIVTDGSTLYPYINESSTYLRISRDVDGSSADELIVSDLSSGSSDLYMAITYFV